MVKDAPACPDDASVKEGGRHDFLMRVGGKLRTKGLDFETVSQSLKELNESTCNPPLADEAVTAIAETVCNYEPEAEPVKEPTIPEKMEKVLQAKAFELNKLSGVTTAAYRVKEAMDILTGELVGFDRSHSVLNKLDSVLLELEKYT